MTRGRLLTLLILVLTTGYANAETLTYEAYSIGPGRSRVLISEGTREYTVRDVVVEARPAQKPADVAFWSKDVPLFRGFSVGARIFRETSLNGFGLVVRERDHPDGFSWEWFYRERANEFVKLQGHGRVTVSITEGHGYQELAAVEFLTDITLRFEDDKTRHSPGDWTHEILIKRGSVLRVAP